MPINPHPSLRWRLVTIMCLAYIIVAAVTELVSYRQQSTNLQHQLDSRARSDAMILAAGAVSPLRTRSAGELDSLNSVVTSLANQSGVAYAAVYGPDGCVIDSSHPQRRPKCLQINGVLSGKIAYLDNGDVRSLALVADSAQVLGAAEVVASGSAVAADLHDALISDLVLRCAGLALFLILTLAIAQYALGPLTSLARAAGDIRVGRLDTRVPEQGHAELATVAEAFNRMAASLEERIEHLSFLSTAAPELPVLFRDQSDLTPILAQFCRLLRADGVALLARTAGEEPSFWYDAAPGERSWREVVPPPARIGAEPSSAVEDRWTMTTVPVLQDTVFVAVRPAIQPFSAEERQVVTNFAFQMGVAADNARLFASQQEALQVKDQFLSIVSHELRTPLTTIKGYSQMLRRRLADDPEASRFANNIDTQAGRLGRLVDDLLDVTRFSRGQFELKWGIVNLHELLAEAITRFRLVAPSHTFDLSVAPGTYTGRWDHDRLEQVLNNLIGNAAKYSPAGSHVVVTAEEQNGIVTVTVRDQGPGIAAEDRAHLFERFYRGTAESGQIAGLGLGLYVTQRIVEAHGGTIGVRSEEGQGSEFYFALPLVPVEAGAPVASGLLDQ